MIGTRALPADRRYGGHRLGEQRTDDQLSAALDGILGGRASAFLRALVILDNELQARRVALEEGELGRLLQSLGNRGGLRTARQRQQHGDLDGTLGIERALGGIFRGHRWRSIPRHRETRCRSMRQAWRRSRRMRGHEASLDDVVSP